MDKRFCAQACYDRTQEAGMDRFQHVRSRTQFGKAYRLPVAEAPTLEEAADEAIRRQELKLAQRNAAPRYQDELCVGPKERSRKKFTRLIQRIEFIAFELWFFKTPSSVSNTREH